MGIPPAMIDSVSFLAAKAVYTGWGLTFNGAFWYKQDRQKVIASLLTMCHSCLDVGETIKLRVLSKASMATITSADVTRSSEQGPGTFSYRDIANEDYSDSGYIAYQPTGEAQDELAKVLVAVDGAASVISSEVLSCPFVQDAQDVKRIGQLHFERKLMKTAEASFTTKGTRIALQPDDRITINDDNYGGTYVVLIDSVKISKDLSIQFNCSDYSISFNDWTDLSPTDQTIPADTVTSSWQPVMSGPDTTTGITGSGSNILPGRLRIGSTDSYILLEPADPLHISVFENDVETTRMGNLNGFDGYTTDVFGFAVRGPGKIGGWKIQPTLIQSDVAGSARIELDQGNARISVKDSTNAYKTVMGYLNGLAKHDGTGNWGSADYGFWAATGDNLKFDGDVKYKSGSWIVENDGSFLVQNALLQTIIRLGTDSGEKGLFIYDTSGTQLAKLISNKVFIGEAGKYFEYSVTGGLIVKTDKFELSADGSMVAVGGTFKSSNSGARTQVDEFGVTIYAAATSGKWNTFKWGDGTKWGAGVRLQIGNPNRDVPIYFPASTNNADIHLGPRSSTPSGAAEVNDICAVNGVLYICTGAGTPGTWVVVGTQT